MRFSITRFLLLILLLSLANIATCQIVNYRISGKVVDSLSGSKIIDLNLFISDLRSTNISKEIKYDLLDSAFLTEELNHKIAGIMISSPGYTSKIIKLPEFRGLTVDLGIVYISKNAIQLSEVNIKLKKLALQLDTLKFEFKDSIFNGAVMAGEVLKLVPGIEVIKNQIYFKGEILNNIVVNGQKFFFNDNFFMMKNLPGFSIDNIQIIKPNSNQKRYLNDAPVINIILKEQSNSGYLAKLLGAYGVENKRVLDVFVGKLSPSYRLGINLDNNNVNDKNAMSLDRNYTQVGLSNLTNAKATIEKKTKKIELELDFSKSELHNSDIRETYRIDNINNEIYNSAYINSNSTLQKKMNYTT